MDEVWKGKWSEGSAGRQSDCRQLALPRDRPLLLTTLLRKMRPALTPWSVLLPAVLVVADVLDVPHHVPAQAVLPHGRQHLPVHQVVRPQAVGVAAVASGEVFADVQPFARGLLVANRPSPFSLVTLAYLQKREQPETKHFTLSATRSLRKVRLHKHFRSKQQRCTKGKKKSVYIPQSLVNYSQRIVHCGERRPEDWIWSCFGRIKATSASCRRDGTGPKVSPTLQGHPEKEGPPLGIHSFSNYRTGWSYLQLLKTQTPVSARQNVAMFLKRSAKRNNSCMSM